MSQYDYGIDEWEDLIYNEVAQGRPVLYAGTADIGGHAFVCDGYDGQGRFHINWGWNGLANSYFSLSVLDYQEASRADANQSGAGFTIDQNAVIGIKPAETPITDYSNEPILVPSSPYFIYKITDDGTFSLYTKVTVSDRRFNSIVLQSALFSKKNDGTLLMRPFFIGDDNPEYAYESLVYGDAEYETYIKPLQTGAYLREKEVSDLTYVIEPWKEGNYMLVLYEETSPQIEIAYTTIKFPATPTAISNISTDDDGTVVPAVIYDLQGRRVEHPTSHGIYIQNGKKW